MATSRALYKHLWEPKKTARDWGKTDYRIIRTWTPRAPADGKASSEQEREGHSRDSDQRSRDQQHHESAHEAGPETDAEELELEEAGSLQSLQKGPRGTERAQLSVSLVPDGEISTANLSHHKGNDGGEIKGAEQEDEGEGGNIENLASTTHDNNSHEEIISPSNTRELDEVRSVSRRARRSEPAVLASESREGRRGPSGRGREGDDIESDTEDLLNEGSSSHKVSTTKKRRQVNTTKKSVFTLWLITYARSGRDLNELDICLSTYDSAMRDAIENEGDVVVRRALVQHWKLTRKYMLSTIRDLSAVSALEKRYRQEVSKNRRLQKESLSTLKTLRLVNGKFLRATSKAKQARQTRKLAVDGAEIDELSSRISAYMARRH